MSLFKKWITNEIKCIFQHNNNWCFEQHLRVTQLYWKKVINFCSSWSAWHRIKHVSFSFAEWEKSWNSLPPNNRNWYDIQKDSLKKDIKDYPGEAGPLFSKISSLDRPMRYSKATSTTYMGFCSSINLIKIRSVIRSHRSMYSDLRERIKDLILIRLFLYKFYIALNSGKGCKEVTSYINT